MGKIRAMGPMPKIHEVTEYILGLVAGWQADEVNGIRYLEGGYGNHNYYFRHGGNAYAIRIPFADQPYVDRKRESLTYRELPAGLSVDVVAVDLDKGIMISHWVEGAMLTDHGDTTAAQLGQFVHHLHTNTPDAGRVYDPHELARTYLSGTGAPTEILNIASERWTPASLDNCHNDLNPWNVIVTESSWRVLDFEFAGRNDPLFDVVNLAEGLDLPWNDLVEIATCVIGDTPTEERLFACYQAFWLREYAWARHQIELGNDRSKIHEQAQIAYDKLRHASI